jgi:hypothetical protein
MMDEYIRQDLEVAYERFDLEFDPDFWAMLFDFGRALIEKGDKVIAANWRNVYMKYISSNVWKAKAFDAIEAAGNKCQLCNSPKFLQVHHRTYDRLGKEPLDDLITLCNMCHSKFHKIGKFNVG